MADFYCDHGAYAVALGSIPTWGEPQDGDGSAAATNATAVRTELTTELGRIDAAVSTRLATAGYTAPDNTSVTAIKAVTDEIVITDGLVHGDVKKQNGVTVYGTGITTDKWRGTP